MSLPSYKKYIRLDQNLGWQRKGELEQSENNHFAHQLSPVSILLGSLEKGPYSVDSPDGAIGGLALPINFAFSPDRRLIIADVSISQADLKIFDPIEQKFQSLGISLAEENYKFTPPVAVVGSALFVVGSSAKKLIKLDFNTGQRTEIQLVGDVRNAKIVDITCWRNRLIVLTSRKFAIIIIDPDNPVDQQPIALTGRWPKASRVLVDNDDIIWVLTKEGLTPAVSPWLGDKKDQTLPVDQLGLDWARAGIFKKDACEVAHLFNTPAIRPFLGNNEERIFFLDPELARPFHRKWPVTLEYLPQPGMDYYMRLQALDDQAKISALKRLIFTMNGVSATAKARVHQTPRFEKFRPWKSAALDSEVAQCQWHRIVFTVAYLPPDASIKVFGYADNVEFADGEVENGLFQEICGLHGSHYALETSTDQTFEFLFQGMIGRFLYLKLELNSSGYDTPVIRAIRIDFPRQAFTDLLPPIYSAEEYNEGTGYFLSRYLSIFEAEWEKLEHRLEARNAKFRPSMQHDKDWTNFLASWLGFDLPRGMDTKRANAVLMKISQHFHHLTTMQAVRGILAAFLQPDAAEKPSQFPILVEGYRERRRSMRMMDSKAGLSGQEYIVGRSYDTTVRIGSNAKLGTARLGSMSKNDCASNIYSRHAFRLTINVPAILLANEDLEEQFVKLITALVPVNVSWKLEKIYPRSRLGLQADCGVNTMLSAHPSATTLPPHNGQPSPLWYDWRDGILSDYEAFSQGPKQQADGG